MRSKKEELKDQLHLIEHGCGEPGHEIRLYDLCQLLYEIIDLIPEVKAGEALAQAIEREPWEYSDVWAKVVHKAWKKFRGLEEPKNGDD